MTKKEIVDRINGIDKTVLTRVCLAIKDSNPVNVFSQNNVWVFFNRDINSMCIFASIEPKRRATKENLLNVYHAIIWKSCKIWG